MSASIFRPRLEAMRATNAHHAERQTREFEQSAALRDCRNRASRRVMDDRKSKDESMQTSHAQRSERSSDNGVQSAIGKRLKAYYDDVASEPVPDRFLSLLDALDDAESSSKAGSK